jgi:Tfp pilus assembly protein PilN
MIKINLLPQSEKPKTPSKAPVIVIAVLIVVIGVVFVFYSIKSAQLSSMKSDIAKLEKRKADLEPKMKDLEDQIDELERKDKAISVLAGQERFLWSKKLNELAILVPDNVKFTHIALSNRDNRTYLRLEGVTYSKDGEERLELVSKLMEALKSKEFYDKPNGSPNFKDIEFLQATADEEKDSGFLVDNFIVQMEII